MTRLSQAGMFVGGVTAACCLFGTPAASSRSADNVLARARSSRHLTLTAADGSANHVRVVYEHAPVQQPSVAGTLEFTFSPSGTIVRREHFPWQRFHTSETTVGDGLFRRWFRDDETRSETPVRGAEANARALAISAWLAHINQVPHWAPVVVELATGVESSSGGPSQDAVVVLGKDFRAELFFDRRSGLLQEMIETPQVANGAPFRVRQGPVGNNVHKITRPSNYRRVNGVLFAGTILTEFRSLETTVNGQGFKSVLKSVRLEQEERATMVITGARSSRPL